ncbi:uncharacterized protein LOC113312509 [Papaver somniferum]|uniref:uncharacterized protein LOC113312509 n=1 Tax=Papaver somniferum TaxID=3469 RepID=UPI000E702093|nr:uncharacterized protein LOC113312509 [Papaver somniferum]
MEIALFSPSSIFGHDEDDDDQSSPQREAVQTYEERTHKFPELELSIREFTFHELNANLLWPGTFSFAECLVDNKPRFQGSRIIELGSGTGALAIFLRKSFGVDITTSDFDDEEVEENIAHNCRVNGIIPALPHIRHTWGETFPTSDPDWDLVIASDILLYVKQYPNLIKTLSFLLKLYKPSLSSPQDTLNGFPCPAFLMSWRRRIGKEDEALFFTGCKDAGLAVEHVGSRVFCISPIEYTTTAETKKVNDHSNATFSYDSVLWMVGNHILFFFFYVVHLFDLENVVCKTVTIKCFISTAQTILQGNLKIFTICKFLNNFFDWHCVLSAM